MKLTHKQPLLPSPGLSVSQAHGFSLMELMITASVLLIVTGAAMNYVAVVAQRSKAEQTKVDLTQEGREFVDEFERDVHQAGYPGCGVFNVAGNCSAQLNSSTVAAGLVYVSNTKIIFEGDVDGNGTVDSVQYQVVDSAGNAPPTGTCPCTIQRSQVNKVTVAGALTTTGQPPVWSQEVQNVVNSGVPATGANYGGGLPIAGNVLFANGAITNTAYYAAVTTFKDFPVFSFYDQFGNWPSVNGLQITLPQDYTTAAGQAALAQIKSVRITLNLLGSGSAGYDPRTGVRPVVTLVGDGRRNNCQPNGTLCNN